MSWSTMGLTRVIDDPPTSAAMRRDAFASAGGRERVKSTCTPAARTAKKSTTAATSSPASCAQGITKTPRRARSV
jgi:hypothetical protein